MDRQKFREQDSVNVEAAEIMGEFHDLLKKSGYNGHELNVILVRIVFCLFADDTGIFERDSFQQLIERHAEENTTHVGRILEHLFQILNRPIERRQEPLDEDLAKFPFVNGGLFKEKMTMVDFNSEMCSLLLSACEFNWSAISPAIFGALFQSVLESEERRTQGTHYTTEKNILKVIEPLFLDDLYAEFQSLKKRRGTRKEAELKKFWLKLGQLKFLDPACGCGNFLVIAYRELRKLEIAVIHELRKKVQDKWKQSELTSEMQSLIDVNQFYGIELDEYPVRIAETALWMMDHIMNLQFSQEFGEIFMRIPLENSPHILHADALATDWSNLLPADQCFCVFGNPPFVGAKLQTKIQRQQVREIAELNGISGTLDYVSAWFIRAGEYFGKTDARVGFVATNSITQGEQVAQLWPILNNRFGFEISFAHRTFAWGSEARGKAQVHVIIIGLASGKKIPHKKKLFSYADGNGEPDVSVHGTISPYLFGADGLENPNVVVCRESRPINGLPRIVIGSKPIDGGNYILTEDECEELVDFSQFIRPYVGSKELLNNEVRKILWLGEAPPDVLKHPEISRRISAVRKVRETSSSASTRKLAKTPTLYHVNTIPDKPFLAIPETSSEFRAYVPFSWLEPPTIPSNSIRVMMNAKKATFAILSSAMHMAWLRYIGGRLKSDYRYSIEVVYNTFPLPCISDRQAKQLEQLANAVLSARNEYSNTSLANLYGINSMPANLSQAHQALDRAVDRLYRKSPFKTEHDRILFLLELYEQRTTPATCSKKTTRRRRR